MKLLPRLPWPGRSWRRRFDSSGRPIKPAATGPNAAEARKALAAADPGPDLAAAIAALDFRIAGTPAVSIVVPVYEQIRHTVQCLNSLARLAPRRSFEIILADDASRDETPDWLPRVPGLVYRRSETNRGFLETCNAAAESVRGGHIVLLNNDTAVLPHWLDALIGTFDEHPEAGLVGSMLIWPDGHLQEAGGLVAADGEGWNVGRHGDPDDWRYNHLRRVDYCSGASIAISTNLWRRLGGFDRDFAPGYYEDTDLAFRIRAAGAEVLFQPFSRVVHFEGVTAGRTPEAGMKRAMIANKPRFAGKWRRELAQHPAPGTLGVAPIERAPRGRALWIDTVTLTPDEDAGSLYSSEFLRILRRQGWAVDFLPTQHFDHVGAPTTAMQRAGIGCVYPPCTPSPRAHLREAGATYGLVILSRAPVAAAFYEDVRRWAPGARVVFLTQDLHFLRAERQAAVTGDRDSLAAARRWRRQELRIAGVADATIVVSAAEAEVLRREGVTRPVHVIPLIQPVFRAGATFERRAGLCFLGSYGHPPNGDAVRHFTTEIWPVVAAALPEARFEIVGRGAPVLPEAAHAARIVAHGHVPDLADVFGRVRLSVAPLRFGAGMKGKVIASLAHGVPVVTTSIGAEGIGLRHRHDAMIADTPEAFAAAVCELHESEALWRTLSANGYALAERDFSRAAAEPRVAAAARSDVGPTTSGRR